MEHLAEFLKLIFEKGSWLAAVALVAIALAVARYYGYLADADTDTVFLVYLAGAICGGVLLTGGVVAGFKFIRKRSKAASAKRRLRMSAVRNLETLPFEYQKVLLWLVSNDIQRLSEDGDTSTLDTFAAQGYLEREDDPDNFNVIRTYRVTDEIWAELKGLDLTEIKGRLPKEPPWRDRDWRI